MDFISFWIQFSSRKSLFLIKTWIKANPKPIQDLLLNKIPSNSFGLYTVCIDLYGGEPPVQDLDSSSFARLHQTPELWHDSLFWISKSVQTIIIWSDHAINLIVVKISSQSARVLARVSTCLQWLHNRDRKN